MSASSEDRASTAVAFLVAAGALGRAVQLNNGAFSPAAMIYLDLAIVACVAGVALPRSERLERAAQRSLRFVALAILGLQLWQIGVSQPVLYAVESVVGAPLMVASLVLTLGIAVAVAAGYDRPWLAPVALIVWLDLACWLLWLSRGPRIDVVLLHRAAIDALVHGHNPYAITIPNIYGHVLFYAPGYADLQTVRIGFPYPPWPLAVAAVGQLVAGDFRFAYVGAVAAGVGLMLAADRPARALLPLLIFLFTPRAFFVIEQGWTEPATVLALGATLFALARRRGWLPWAWGLLLASKQYMIITLPTALFFFPRGTPVRNMVRPVAVAAIVAALTLVPFALWDPRQLFDSLVLVHARTPFRADALSHLAWWHGWYTGSALGFVVAAGAVWLALRCLPRTASGFAGALALELLAFFSFNRQAFCNYYYLVIAALCAAVALRRV
jgi:hypothetical protein